MPTSMVAHVHGLGGTLHTLAALTDPGRLWDTPGLAKGWLKWQIQQLFRVLAWGAAQCWPVVTVINREQIYS